jgi:uncharacterized protein (TIGR00730 family)
MPQSLDALSPSKFPTGRRKLVAESQAARHMMVMPYIHSVAVFCGSRTGNDPRYREAAQALGRGLAEAGIKLVYGGGGIGLMGVVADAVLLAGGSVHGVIPEFLTRREVAHPSIGELDVTDSMHSRKQRMFELADAFISLPGGLGTLDETVEILTWRQLHLHAKPILIFDVAGSARPLMAAIEAAVAAGFASADVHELYELFEEVPAMIDHLTRMHRAPQSEAARL